MSYRQVGLMAVVALLVFVGLDLRVLQTHDLNPTAFILQRDPALPDEQDWGIGYDAQWYYAIARDPIGAAALVDQPGYRYRRILYPLVVRALSLGNDGWIPWAMLVVNLAAGVGCAAFLGILLQRRQAPPWAALILVFSLGFLFSMRTNLLEPFALALALAGWLAYEKEKPYLAVALFGAGVLTKEFVLTFPASLLLWELYRKNYARAAGVFLGSIMPYILWAGMVFRWFGLTEKGLAQSRLSLLPFAGVGVLEDLPSLAIVSLWILLPVGVWAVLAAFDLLPRRRSNFGKEHVLVLVSFVLLAALPELTWFDPLAVLRTGLGMLAAGLLWSAVAAPRLLPYAAGLYLPSGLVLALVPGMFS